MSHACAGLTIKHWGNSYTYVTAIPLWDSSWRDSTTRESHAPEGEEKINKSDHQVYLYMREQDQGVKQFDQCHKSCWWQWHHPWQSCSWYFTFPPLDLPQLFDSRLNKAAVSLSLSPIDSSISCWHLRGANHPDIWEPAVRAGLIGTEATSQSLTLPSFPFMWDCEMEQIGRLIERQRLSTLWVYKAPHRNVIPSFRQLWSPQGNWCHQLVISNGSRSKTYSFPFISIFIRKIIIIKQYGSNSAFTEINMKNIHLFQVDGRRPEIVFPLLSALISHLTHNAPLLSGKKQRKL